MEASVPTPTRAAARPLLLAAGMCFVLDQLSKYWLLNVYGMPARSPQHLNEYFALVMAWNKGVSFSMFAHSAEWMPYALVALALGICGMLVHLGLKSHHRFERIGYGLVIGGALGNALDRVRFGAVADFFYVHLGDLGWPAFNVADMGICCGVGLLLVAVIKPAARP